MNDKKLSKTISYALRHAPEKFDLTPAKDGSVPLADLLSALDRRGFKGVTREDIERIIRNSDKKRHEIIGNRIRATYGHSFKTKIHKPSAPPPETLYHGTSRRAWQKIKTEGLRPMGRQYVHLSSDIKTAAAVGRRHDPKPLILEVAAAEAAQNGILFYPATDGTWNCDPVPARFLQVVNRKS